MRLNCRVKWRDKLLHWAFEVGIWLKGLDGILELIGGTLLLAFSPEALNHFIVVLTQHELNEDPGNWISHALRHAGNHLSSDGKFIGGIYLLGHGAVKVFLVGGILRGKLWAYPTAMIVLGIFILLQSSRMGLHFSYFMLFFTGIDIVIVLLIWREFRRAKRNAASS